jgi:O-antigen/teichoic acid export membrane protein
MQRFDLIFIANAVAALTMIGGAILMPAEQTAPSSVFLLMTCASLAGCGVCFGLINRAAVPIGVYRLSREEKRRILGYAANIWITALLWNIVWSRGEVPMVRAFLGEAALAQYAVALTLVGGATSGVMLGIGGIAPQVTRHLGEGRAREAMMLCRQVMDLQILVCGAAGLILVWMAPELLRLAFGDQYAGASGALAVLALTLPALALALHNHALQITTDARFNRNANIAGLVVLLGLGFVLIPSAGLLGASISRTVALVFVTVLSIIAVNRYFSTQGLAIRNLALVYGVTTGSVLYMLYRPGESLLSRMAFLVFLSAMLSIGIRSQNGSVSLVVSLAFLRKK